MTTIRLAWLALVFSACVPATQPRDRMPSDDADASTPNTAIDAGAAAHDGGATDAGAAGEPDAAGSAQADAAASPDAELADPPDAGGAPDASGPPPELYCDSTTMRDAAGDEVATYETNAVCEEVLAARGEGVVCRYFEVGDRIGPNAWDEVGWRAMNWRTRTGLGRRPHETYAMCLDATRNARGGVVCTNTGVGYKSAHVETNQWCGASSSYEYCLMASIAARNYYVCSFPSDGDGSGPGWNLTQIDGTTCNYGPGGLYLADCNAMIP